MEFKITTKQFQTVHDVENGSARSTLMWELIFIEEKVAENFIFLAS